MTTIYRDPRFSAYLKGIIQGFLGVSENEDQFPSTPPALYFALMTAEGVETTAYTGYARQVINKTYYGPASDYHCKIELEGPGTPFAPFTAEKTLHSIGVYDASTGGNLLIWFPYSFTRQVGDELTLDTMTVYFNDDTGGPYLRANSCAFMSEMIAKWLVDEFGDTDSVQGKRFSEVNVLTKDRRCMIVESTSSTTGVVWGYPTGGPPLIGSTGAAIVKHATAVAPISDGDVTVTEVPGVTGSTELCLTMIQSGFTTWQMADYGIPFSGLVTKVTYAVVTQAGGSPPPNTVDGVRGDDIGNIFIPLAVWTPSGASWSFTAETTKLAWTLGLAIQREYAYTPDPTYPGDLTGITTVNTTHLLSSGGYNYEHSLVSMNLSELIYSVSTIFTQKEYDSLDSFTGYAEPVEVTLYNPDPVYEIVEMRRAVADVRSGDSHVAFSFRLRTSDGDTPSIEGKTVVVRYSVNGAATLEVRGSAQADYSSSGRVLFALPAAALADPGQVRAELVLEGAGGSTQTYPFDDTIFISVMKSL